MHVWTHVYMSRILRPICLCILSQKCALYFPLFRTRFKNVISSTSEFGILNAGARPLHSTIEKSSTKLATKNWEDNRWKEAFLPSSQSYKVSLAINIITNNKTFVPARHVCIRMTKKGKKKRTILFLFLFHTLTTRWHIRGYCSVLLFLFSLGGDAHGT